MILDHEYVGSASFAKQKASIPYEPVFALSQSNECLAQTGADTNLKKKNTACKVSG